MQPDHEKSGDSGAGASDVNAEALPKGAPVCGNRQFASKIHSRERALDRLSDPALGVIAGDQNGNERAQC